MHLGKMRSFPTSSELHIITCRYMSTWKLLIKYQGSSFSFIILYLF